MIEGIYTPRAKQDEKWAALVLWVALISSVALNVYFVFKYL